MEETSWIHIIGYGVFGVLIAFGALMFLTWREAKKRLEEAERDFDRKITDKAIGKLLRKQEP